MLVHRSKCGIRRGYDGRLLTPGGHPIGGPSFYRRDAYGHVIRRASGMAVRATVATSAVVTVADRYGDPLDEVLLMAGAALPKRVPLLDGHGRESAVNQVLGTASEFERTGDQLLATLRFGGSVAAMDAWKLVEAGHVDSVSAGYVVDEALEIRPGDSRVVRGVVYEADRRTLRVVTRWTLREVSIVAIPADERAKIMV